MPDPIVFDTATPRFGLPMLFAGQAQKEAFVNEAFAIADALLHCTVNGEAADPPSEPADGAAWIVSPNASGAWQDHGGDIACRQAGNWLFVTPRNGMRVHDMQIAQTLLYADGWQRPTAPENPTGGTTIDQEARDAIALIVAAMRDAGMLPAS